MNKVTITQAAKLANISRSTLYNKYITPGIISVETVEDKKLIDVSELIRVFGNVQLDHNVIQPDTPYNTPNTSDKDRIIQLLERELAEARQSAKERESWLKSQIDELRQAQNNLLEDKTKKRKKIFGIF